MRMRRAMEASSTTTVAFTSPVSGATVLAASDGAAALGFACTEASGVAVMGSGLHRLRPDPDDAARSLLALLADGDEALLRGLPTDVAVVSITSAGDVVVAGRAGQQRLFRYEDDETFVAASRVGLVAQGIGDTAAIDRSYEDFLLSYAFLPDGHTLCRGVEMLPVDTVLRRAAAPTATPADLRSRDDRSPDAASPSDQLYHLLLDIVADQAGDDTDVGVLLGGVDSAIVAALLHRLGYRVHTFTFQFEEARYNQRNIELACTSTAAEHTWVPITVDVIGDGLRRYGEIYNQPVAQPHYLLHTLASCEAMRRTGLRHAFSGDGADAAFLGYPTVNQRARLLQRAGRVPRSLRHAAARVAGAKALDQQLGHAGRKARAVLEQADATGAARGHLPTPIFDAAARRRLRDEQPPQAETVDTIRTRLAGGLDGLDVARLALHGHALVGQSRIKVEGAVAATGVAQSSPYLDERLRAFAASLDPNVLRAPGAKAGDMGKQLMLEMAEQHSLLPREVIFQPKQSPVDAPIDDWYAGPLRGEILDLLGGLPFAWDRGYVDGLFDGGRVDGWYRNRVAGLGHHILQPIGLLTSYAACARQVTASP
jgi:asparagine synthetase B (glutamine-hydrolysing)